MQYHLIGCYHNDPNGEDRVRRALDQLQPDLITLEWYGHEAHPLRRTPEFQAALARYHELARAAVEELGYDPAAYDEANRLASTWGPEVRGALAWAGKRGIYVCPTEEPTQGDDYDRRLVENPEKEAALFVDWIREMWARGEEYHPLVFSPKAHDADYYLFEAHLLGYCHEEISMEVDRCRRGGVLNRWRYDFEVNVVRALIHSLSSRTTLVHVGGAMHLVDAGSHQPPTLFQTIKQEFPAIDIVRHSLRAF